MTRLCFVGALRRGNLHLKVKEFHDRYGKIVRIAPDELSYIEGQAWQDLYTGQTKNKGLQKNRVVFGAQEFSSILDGTDDDHTRMRKVLAHSFSNQALYRQEALLHQYIQKLIDKLRICADTGKVANIVEWYNFLSFDITGELAFSEPFDQLHHTVYHPWVKMIVGHLKYSAWSICLRYYAPLDKLMLFFAPPSLRRLKWLFVSMAREKVLRRVARPDSDKLDDILGACLPGQHQRAQMDMEELVGTFSFLIVAGSETTATVLAGMTNYLCGNPRVYDLLKQEVRSVKEAKDFTITSTAPMPYLNAVIKEGLRMCYPIPSALTRLVPAGGMTICGEYVPGGVSHHFTLGPAADSHRPHFNPQSLI